MNNKRLEKLFVLGMLLQGVLIPLLLGFLFWPKYYEGIAHEDSPLNWFSGTSLWTLGFISFNIWYFSQLRASSVKYGWLLLTAAFFFLSLDEQFQFHEHFRDRFLLQKTNFQLPFLQRGELLMPLYILAGGVTVYLLWKHVRIKGYFRNMILAGLFISAVAVFIDTTEIIHERYSPRMSQTVEEILEYLAEACWLSGFLSYFFTVIHEKG